MFRNIKFNSALLMTIMLAGCAVPELKIPELANVSQELGNMLKAGERAEYQGSDSVDIVDPDMLIGTWKVEVINSVALEEDLDIQISFNEDETISAILKADIEEPIGKFAYDMKGTWSADGEYVTITPTSMQETTGNALAGSGEEFFDEEGDVANVYEISADRIVMFDENERIAQSYTRIK